MSKYIDVDVFIKSFREALPGLKAQVDPDLTPKACAYLRGGEAIIEDLTKFPAADVAPVRHGEWLNFYGDFSTAECELCAELYEVSPDESPQKEYFDAFKEFYRYCPNCGAKMDGEREKGAGNE